MSQDYPEAEPTSVEPATTQPARPGIPLPLYKPRATFVLLGLIGVVFVLQLITDTLNMRFNLTAYGAQINALVAYGDYWRLLTAMFLHFGIAHFIFNGWALLSLGQEVEALYGTGRFVLLYFLAGLFGGMASYLFAPPGWLLVPSAGASGAIFGIIGANVAFFLVNRGSMGSLGRQRLMNLAILIVINVAIGVSPGSGINNYAHMGGLLGGLALGLGLAPRYAAAWDYDRAQPRLVNHRSAALQGVMVAAIIILLLAGIYLGDQRWAPYLSQLR